MPSLDPLGRKVVLVVEDDDDLRSIFRNAIRGAGYGVREADDGLDALRIVEIDPPDLVVLDVRLPALDGISVREEIAANAQTRHIPVIIVTAFDIDRQRVRNARIMRKPVEPDELVDAVRSALRT
jgi:two-component system phosphate regulon response regulator PhoB